jgi:L-ascorbate metabolism protein UlaG (beta-lactamase superfamily)
VSEVCSHGKRSRLAGEIWNVTGTQCKHRPGGQVVGFNLRVPRFGFTNGLPNVIWYSGDTVYLEELSKIKDIFHIRAAIFNMSDAHANINESDVQITMNSSDVARFFKAVKADILAPMHFDP